MHALRDSLLLSEPFVVELETAGSTSMARECQARLQLHRNSLLWTVHGCPQLGSRLAKGLARSRRDHQTVFFRSYSSLDLSAHSLPLAFKLAPRSVYRSLIVRCDQRGSFLDLAPGSEVRSFSALFRYRYSRTSFLAAARCHTSQALPNEKRQCPNSSTSTVPALARRGATWATTRKPSFSPATS